MDTLSRLAQYFGLLFSAFFKWWWAIITGVASVGSFLAVPESGVSLSPLVFGICVLMSFALVFLTLTTVYQGWRLFDQRLTSASYADVCAHDQYEGGLAYLLSSHIALSNGTLVELRRSHEGAESLLAVLEVVESNARGQLQAQAVWVSPGHLRDLRLNKIQRTDLTVSPVLSARTLSVVIADHVE